MREYKKIEQSDRTSRFSSVNRILEGQKADDLLGKVFLVSFDWLFFFCWHRSVSKKTNLEKMSNFSAFGSVRKISPEKSWFWWSNHIGSQRKFRFDIRFRFSSFSRNHFHFSHRFVWKFSLFVDFAPSKFVESNFATFFKKRFLQSFHSKFLHAIFDFFGDRRYRRHFIWK